MSQVHVQEPILSIKLIPTALSSANTIPTFMAAKIAIITPYHKECDEILLQCHESVLAQKGNFKARHFMVADGFPKESINTWNCNHICLHKSHDDNGNTPRGIGCILAESENYDFIGFLDADNWYHPNHLGTLIDLHKKTDEPVVASWRTYHLPDGSQLNIEEEAENNMRHVDTSCFLLEKRAFSFNRTWSNMPKELSPMCDRIFLSAIRHGGFNFASTRTRSIAFRTQYANHYTLAGLIAPEDAKMNKCLEPCMQYLRSGHGVSECIKKLGFWPPSYFSM